MPLLTPRQFVEYQVYRYADTWGSSSEQVSTLLVYDFLFNTVGNGIRSQDELLTCLSHLPLRKDQQELAISRMNDGYMSYGYYEAEERGGILVPKNVGNRLLALQREKDNHPSIAIWVDFSIADRAFVPCSNFQESYSILYRSDFKFLGKYWITEAIWFYTKCAEFFLAGAYGYEGKYPTNNAEQDANRLRSFQEYIMTRYDTNEAISQQYGIRYDGDIEEFTLRRWAKEKERILLFIDKTLSMLRHWLSESRIE